MINILTCAELKRLNVLFHSAIKLDIIVEANKIVSNSKTAWDMVVRVGGQEYHVHNLRASRERKIFMRLDALVKFCNEVLPAVKNIIINWE